MSPKPSRIYKISHHDFYRSQVNLGSNLWVRLSVSLTPCVDLTDVTLADEDTNSIPTDKVNRAIPGKSGFVTENTWCHKKIRRAQFFFKSLFLLRGFSKYHLKTSLRRNKLFKKNRICLIFFWHALCLNFFPDFVLTLEADNYGLKAPIFKNYHIFGNLRTSAFTWCHPR